MPREEYNSLISLNKAEKEICEILAKKRYDQARGNKTPNTLVKYSSDFLEADREGVYSEMAFCKMVGVYPEFVLTIAVMSVKNGKDFGDVLYKNKNIDVKSTTHEGGKLIAHSVNPNIDYYALMVGRSGDYRLAGLMKSDILCTEERYGHHKVFRKKCFKADQEELVSLEEIEKNA